MRWQERWVKPTINCFALCIQETRLKFAPRDLPNLISFGRLLAVLPFVFLLLKHQFAWALVVFLLAGISDGLDGFLAKRFGWESRLGGIIDPLADKILLVAAFLVLGALSLIPVWLVIAAITRDFLIVGGATLYHYRVEELRADPLLTSKLNTLLQILLVIAVVTDAGLYPLPGGLMEALIWSCLLSILISGVQYVWIWWHKALEKGFKE